jgi:hypothetical protein
MEVIAVKRVEEAVDRLASWNEFRNSNIMFNLIPLFLNPQFHPNRDGGRACLGHFTARCFGAAGDGTGRGSQCGDGAGFREFAREPARQSDGASWVGMPHF